MWRKIKVYTNLLTDTNDIDYLNSLVDDAIRNTSFDDDSKTATDIEYEVTKCDKAGNATLTARFNYG